MRDALFWSLVCAAVLGILAMVGSVPDYGVGGFTVVMVDASASSDPETGVPVLLLIVVSAFAAGFGMLMAWGCQRIPNGRRDRSARGLRAAVKMGEGE